MDLGERPRVVPRSGTTIKRDASILIGRVAQSFAFCANEWGTMLSDEGLARPLLDGKFPFLKVYSHGPVFSLSIGPEAAPGALHCALLDDFVFGDRHPNKHSGLWLP
jgi:hypothetical protein